MMFKMFINEMFINDRRNQSARDCHGPRFRRGAVMTEFAFILPILAMLVFGIIEVGRAIMVQQIITNGAREGARRAIIPGATDANVTAIVNQYFTGTSVPNTNPTITPSLATAQRGDLITVNVSVPYGNVSWGVLNWFDGVTLQARVVMREE